MPCSSNPNVIRHIDQGRQSAPLAYVLLGLVFFAQRRQFTLE